ncbi:hypothetical protein ACQUQU_13465 [Thalassolituus sp. LLYu03]|uniref:hypothetical protein n=1 Tax=Thalassolituus sp. LLYu03 TaxID=3421656 RepID=UPI003D2B6F52
MLISLNYAIFLLALLLGLDLYRRGNAFRPAATHLALFASAALLGGLAHHMELEHAIIRNVLATVNDVLPGYFRLSHIRDIFTRLWFLTFIAIGFTEYYFMRIFLHPVAEHFQLHWIKPTLTASVLLFCTASLLISEYSLVVTYHVLTHLLIIGFSLFLIIQYRLRIFWILISLVTLNLIAGALWSLMALGKIPTGPLHYNDWYHILLLVFVVYLHQVLTRGGLIQALQQLPQPHSTEMAAEAAAASNAESPRGRRKRKKRSPQ